MNLYFPLIIFHIFIFNYLGAEKFTIASIGEFESFEQIRFQSKSGPKNIHVNEGFVNSSHIIPEGRLIHFYSYDPINNATSANPVLRIEFENYNEQIILLSNNEEITDNIEYEIIDNNIRSFPFTSIFIFNMSDKKIVGFIDKTIIKIEPNSKKVIPLSKNQYGTFNGEIEFYERNKFNKTRRIYSSYSRITSNNKLLFIFKDSKEDNHLNAYKLAFSENR